MTPRRFVFPALALASIALPTLAQDYVSPAQARLKADVYYLADDAREGRGPGTKGLDAAADYVAASFKEAGLKPAPGADGYFQTFELPGRRTATDASALSFKVKDEEPAKARFESDFTPLALGGAGEFQGLPIVFAGYGITAKQDDPKLDYDDYADLDAKGKAVLILRRKPQQDKPDGPFGDKDNTTFSSFNHKVANAAEHGAKVVLLVNDAVTVKDAKDELLGYSAAGGGGNADYQFFQVTREFADKLLKAAGSDSLADLEKAIDTDLKPRSKPLDGATLDGVVKVENRGIKVKNVVGVLEGAGPQAEETVVVGAHYDHVGMGEFGSLSGGVRAIHNGADDNASGTATVMELARRLGKRSDPLPRRVVFMAFSAEELGLIGSRYYVDHPLYPLDKTVGMLNFDMVGRLNKERDVTVFGTGTSPGFEALVTTLLSDQGMKANNIVGTSGEFYQSDHASFYMKNMPIVFFFTGTHADYHRPADDSDKINYEGMARIANVGELLALDIARRPDRPEFISLAKPAKAAAASEPASGKTMGAAYFGSRPSYGDNGGKGVKLDGVTEGGPAEKAGLKEGDVIVKFADKDVTDLDTYMAALGSKKPGDTVDVVVKREGEDKTFTVKLGSRPGSSPKN